jgi:hypothetical protein
MKPDRSILHRSFRYVPAVSTSVADTWRRFGWRPAKETSRLVIAQAANDVQPLARSLRRAGEERN